MKRAVESLNMKFQLKEAEEETKNTYDFAKYENHTRRKEEKCKKLRVSDNEA